MIFAEEYRKNVLDRGRMVEYFAGYFYFVPVGTHIGEDRAVHPDAVDNSFCQCLAGFDFNELIFDGGTAAINDKNIHGSLRSGFNSGRISGCVFPLVVVFEKSFAAFSSQLSLAHHSTKEGTRTVFRLAQFMEQ